MLRTISPQRRSRWAPWRDSRKVMWIILLIIAGIYAVAVHCHDFFSGNATRGLPKWLEAKLTVAR